MTDSNQGQAAQLLGERAPVLEWGEGRRLEAQLAMRAVIGRLDAEPFTGTRMRDGQVALEFDDADAAATYFQGELSQYMQDMGADVVLAPPKALAAPGGASKLVDQDEGTLPFAPWESVLINGTVPANAQANRRKAAAQIVEACVELVRVLLANAVASAANETIDPGERIVVRLRGLPELASKINIETGITAGLARVQAIIYCASEPRASYLLGTAYGEPKAHNLGWGFPLVEHLYGPHRLRWRDLRSPDYEPGPAARKAVAS